MLPKFTLFSRPTFFQTGLKLGVFVWMILSVFGWLSVQAQKIQRQESSTPRTILVMDESAILYQSGLKQVLQKPQRHANNPVIRNDAPWELAIGYCTVHRDKLSGRYQCWYQSYAGSRATDPTRRVVLCYANSEDGILWEKPKLKLFDFNGDLDTNIVLVGNGGRSVNYGASVLVDVLDPDPGRRYKLAYWDFVNRNGRQVPGLCVAFSRDGIHWQKHSEAPLLQGAYGEPTQPPLASDAHEEPTKRPAISDVMDLMWDPIGDQYVIYSKTWIDGPNGRRFWKRAVVRTTSKDFIHWTPPELVISPNRHEDGQFHGMSVFYEQGLYLGLLQRLDFGGFDRGGTGEMPAELVWSSDGQQWQRPFPEKNFMSLNSKQNAFDAGCLWTCATPVHTETHTRLYYGAYPGWNADLNLSTTGIGLMTLPKDRWIGLTPVDKQGQVTFKPLHLDEKTRITLNADAIGGVIRLELLNEAGYRVEGFTSDQSDTLTVNDLKHPIKWREISYENQPSGFYQIRIHIKEATLFGLSLHQKSSG